MEDSCPELDRAELRRRIFADVSAMLNNRVHMYESDTNRNWPCEIRELKMLANAFRTYAEGVGVPSIDTLREKRQIFETERDQLKKVAEYALRLRMYGEQAPGGDENWATFDTMVEATLRGLHDSPKGSPREQAAIDRGRALVQQYHPTLYKEITDEEGTN